MKLKTLKNLYDGTGVGEDALIDPDELKDEVIKHIKSKMIRIEEHSHKKFDWNETYLDCLQCRNYFVQIQWIIYFFNVSDEELK